LREDVIKNQMSKVIFTRKPNRLPLKELYQGGHWYFVTICVQDNVEAFVEASPAVSNQPKSVAESQPLLSIIERAAKWI
jgi:hypothetical protein